VTPAAAVRIARFSPAALLLLGLAAGCAGQRAPAGTGGPALDPGTAIRPDPVDRYLALPRRVFGATRAEVVSRLGPPGRVEATPFANLHVAGQVDSLVHLHHAGLEIGFYVVTADRRELLRAVVLASPRHLAGEPVRVGSSLEALGAHLGAPDEVRDGWWTFVSRAEGAEETVSFHASGARVDSIRWSFYVD
jgi:hypothetical protein